MKKERDRFVALAFAAADVLIELDRDFRIRYAAGATQALLGREANALVGKGLFDLVIEDDRDRLRTALAAAPPGARMRPVTLRLNGGKGPPVLAAGYHLSSADVADKGETYYLALSVEKPTLRPPPPAESGRDEETGLFDKDTFGALVGERLKEAKAEGKHYELTLIDLRDFSDLLERVNADVARSFISHVGDTLRASSVGGDSAGRFEDDTYGVLHDETLNVVELKAHISAMTRRLDPEGRGLDVRTATLDAEAAGATPEDTAKAVVYTINKFTKTQGGDFTIASLSEGCTMMVEETIEQIAEFKKIINGGAFKVALQPIVDLENSRIHHYEALARFDAAGVASPYALINFAEEVGVISEFDYAMTERVVALMKKARDEGNDLTLAVNLSGYSLGNHAFIEQLLRLLKDNPTVRNRLWFEITESAHINDLEATNRLIQNLRRAGHPVCLDDFGAGSAAFQYLRALDVDLVKIDGSYVREALTAPNGKAFLKAMAGLCADLGVDVVAEMIEDRETVDFLRACGVQFGQGYLFGKPALASAGEQEAKNPGAGPAKNNAGKKPGFIIRPDSAAVAAFGRKAG